MTALLVVDDFGGGFFPKCTDETLKDHGITCGMIDSTASGCVSVFHDNPGFTGVILISRVSPGIIEVVKIRLKAGEWVKR